MNIQHLNRNDKPKLAYVYTEGQGPLVVFCGGYRSDMEGTKATYFEQQCKSRGQAYLRFDYSGHGRSDGVFDEGTIGEWADDALDVIAHVNAEGRPMVVVGSSMGGWIALLVALARPEQLKGLIGIAAAPDFTEDIYNRLSDALREELHANGFAMVPNDYSDDPYKFTLAFYEEAKAHCILDTHHDFSFPVRLVQGGQDKDVLPETAYKIKENLGETDCEVLFVEDGDHRLSRIRDLEMIDGTIRSISAYTS